MCSVQDIYIFQSMVGDICQSCLLAGWMDGQCQTCSYHPPSNFVVQVRGWVDCINCRSWKCHICVDLIIEERYFIADTNTSTTISMQFPHNMEAPESRHILQRMTCSGKYITIYISQIIFHALFTLKLDYFIHLFHYNRKTKRFVSKFYILY